MTGMTGHDTQIVVQAVCACGEHSRTRVLDRLALVEDWAREHVGYHARVAVLTQRQAPRGQDTASERSN